MPFVAASWSWPWLDRPLSPSVRRQAVCVIQVGGLIIAVLPDRRAGLRALIVAAATPDRPHLIRFWLTSSGWRATGVTDRMRNWITLAAALIVLDASLTFENPGRPR